MKHPSDVTTPRFELRWLRYVVNRVTSYKIILLGIISIVTSYSM